MTADTAALNRLWGELVIDECVRCGVDFFCVSPGSRSTPLALAVARNPRASHVVHFDERGSAFFALGHARATGRPAAWITTSGTAVANGFPAVIEAAADGVPMLLLTADRPPELRDTGANQTIDQPRIFGSYPRWHCDLPAPAAEIDPAFVLTTIDQAVHRACRAPAGPVHLNCMFREPLAGEPGAGLLPLPPRLERWQAGRSPYTRYEIPQTISSGDVDAVWRELRGVRRGLIVAGRLPAYGDSGAVLGLAGALGWPVLPDIGSQLRLGALPNGDPRAVFYDLLLLNEAWAAEHVPEAVLHLGGPAVSKRLLSFLQRHRPRHQIVVRPLPFRLDPHHQVTAYIEGEVAPFCRALAERAAAAAPAAGVGWRDAWAGASGRGGHKVDQLLSNATGLSEPAAARLVSQHVAAEHALVLASSMPIRDMDTFAAPGGNPAPVAINRGASGIDGTVATAAGFSEGLGRPVTLLIGDLALLHDLNSLALLRERQVTIVVINNHGGGIFSMLPVARHEDAFEPMFGTPHPFGFTAAADMFGLSHASPGTPDEFVHEYANAVASGSSAIIEVRTDREENAALHRRLQRQIAAAVEPHL